MQGLTTIRAGQSATTVVRLFAGSGDNERKKADASVTIEGPRPIAALLPQVLAKYGLGEGQTWPDMQPPAELDLLA
jgi:hypothetical protein